MLFFNLFFSTITLFLVPQCKPSRGRKRGICWCVDKYGVQLPGTDYSGGDIQCKDLESSNNNNEWKEVDRPQQPQPPNLLLTTMWPKAHASSLNHAYMLYSLFTSTVLVFFQIEKKREEKNSRQEADNRDTCNFLFCSWPSTHLQMSGESPRWFIWDCWLSLVGLLVWGRSTGCSSMKKYALIGYIFVEAEGFNTLYDVNFIICGEKKTLIGHIDWKQIRFRLWNTMPLWNWWLAVWFVFLCVFSKRKKY